MPKSHRDQGCQIFIMKLSCLNKLNVVKAIGMSESAPRPFWDGG